MSYSIQVDLVNVLPSGDPWMYDIAQLWKSSNEVNNTSTIVADMQGFNLEGNSFVPKELSFSCDGVRIQTVLLKSPRDYTELYRQEKQHIHWLERNHHGLSYTTGDTPLDEICKLLPRDVVNIIVKGKQKEDYFKASFPHCNVLNLENNNNNVVSLVKCFHNCNNHSLMFCTCSKANVNQIINFLNKL